MSKISMTMNEAVEYSGIGRSTLYDLIKEGKLTPKKLGTRTLILTEELDAYVRALPNLKTAA
ncbi:helix-turn-helix domain-containing protein [Rhizobium sp. L245/93]|uniref:helix-turn-helix domain-containing protein n=1 Tax=Rhizobium sp. L245/93 TaxID=2819998 RepID=UPI001AD9E283|nr:helix-turn-helix domain-containing protein [Rhizobium sp. L245/93]MBO9168428.1 helix-turn-helix domain-containing protein [Rhizobium sp. L245/93]